MYNTELNALLRAQQPQQPLGGALKGIQLYAKPKAPGLATAQERKWFPNLNGDMERGPL